MQALGYLGAEAGDRRTRSDHATSGSGGPTRGAAVNRRPASYLTAGQLIEQIRKLAAGLPDGLDTIVEVGMVEHEEGDYDASSAILVEPQTARWPVTAKRPERTEKRLAILGDPFSEEGARVAWEAARQRPKAGQA